MNVLRSSDTDLRLAPNTRLKLSAPSLKDSVDVLKHGVVELRL